MVDIKEMVQDHREDDRKQDIQLHRSEDIFSRPKTYQEAWNPHTDPADVGKKISVDIEAPVIEDIEQKEKEQDQGPVRQFALLKDPVQGRSDKIERDESGDEPCSDML